MFEKCVSLNSKNEWLLLPASFTAKFKFWKTKTFFKKLEHLFLVESTKIENASYQNPMLRHKNKMVTAKCTYHKERSFASNHFSKILFQLKNLL